MVTHSFFYYQIECANGYFKQLFPVFMNVEEDNAKTSCVDTTNYKQLG